MKQSHDRDGGPDRAIVRQTAAQTPAQIGSASTVDADPTPRATEQTDALIGQTLDRYRIESRLGAGGMGVVYAARDPALDRRVALKVLPRIEDHKRFNLEARLWREAQALARLDHPNVVAVHDVGVASESVFIAMQLVDGTTLNLYLEKHRPPTRTIITMFVAAAHGLAAAHAAGIVHRDFKPSNVLVSEDGRVYVGDFGLARGEAEAEVETEGTERRMLDLQLTRAGAVVGTPLYMAPEQHRGEPATARSDQFSFCVALWEALFGAHPFVADTGDRTAMLDAMSRDDIRAPGSSRAVPGPVVRALRRGLAHDPEQRWPSMSELIAELTPASRLPWVLGAISIAGIGGGLALASALGGPSVDPEASCRLAGDALDPLWHPVRRDAITRAFAATRSPIAADTAAKVDTALASYAGDWAAMRLEACRSTHVRGVQSGDLLDRRMRCLDARLAELDGLLTIFEAADADVVANAVRSTSRLSPLSMCADAQGLLARKPPPVDPVERARVDELARAVSRADVTLKAGRYRELEKTLDKLEADVRATGWPPLVAEVAHIAGRLQAELGKYEPAATRLRAAALDAARAGDARLAVLSLARLAHAVIDLDRPADALIVSDDAEVLAAQAGVSDIAAVIHDARGLALRTLSRFRESDAEFAKGLDVLSGRDEYEEARMLNNRAHTLGEMGDNAGSEKLLRRSLALFEKQLGRDHPTVLIATGNLAARLTAMFRAKDALPLLERVLAVRRATLPANHPSIAITLQSLATPRAWVGDFDGALANLREAIAIRKVALGPKHALTLSAEYQVGSTYRQAGRLEEAIEVHRDVLERRIAALGLEHAMVTNSLDALGRAYGDLAERERTAGHADAARTALDRAAEYLTRSRQVREKLYGADSLDVAATRVGLAEVAVARDDCATAFPELERALAYYRKHKLVAEPNHAVAVILLGTCHRRRNEPRAALTVLDELPALGEPETMNLTQLAQGHQLRAELLWDDGDRTTAATASARALELAKRGKATALIERIERWRAAHR